MASNEPGALSPSLHVPTRAVCIVYGGAVAAAIIGAFLLVAGMGMSPLQALGLPLLVAGVGLVAINPHAALCFVAFCITPFGAIQQEVLGVTINLPEFLILLLGVRELMRCRCLRDLLPSALPLVPLILFLLAALVAVGTGVLRQNGVISVLQDFRQFTEFILLFWLVLRLASTPDRATPIALGYVLGAALIAVHGIVQHFTFIGISETQIASDLVLHHGVRSGSFYGATTLGGLMVLAVGPALGVILSSKRRTVQALMVVCIALCLVAAVYTKTRGSWIGLLVAFLFLGVALRPSRRSLMGAAAMGVVLAIFLGPLVVQRIATLGRPENDRSLMKRAQYYTAAYHIGRAHPLLGLGWGCYYDIDAILTAEHYVKTPRPDAATLAQELVDDPEMEENATVHSAYLQLFVKTGVLGLLGFLAIVVVWLERIGRGLGSGLRGDGGYALFVGVTASLAGYLLHSTFENFFQWPVMAQSFWLLLGLSFGGAPLATGRPRFTRPLAIVAVISVVFAGFMAYCLWLETLHTDHYKRNVAKALDEGDLDKALRIAKRATEVALYDPMPKTVYGQLLLQAGDADGALAQLDQALGTIEKPPAPRRVSTGAPYYFAPARLTLGRYCAEQGDWLQALVHFELARAYADITAEEYAGFHPILYRAYFRRGRWARALEFGDPAAGELDGFPDAVLVEIARAYAGRADWDGVLAMSALLRARGHGSPDALLLDGRAQLMLGDAPAAAKTLEAIPEPDQAKAGYILGRALAQSGRPEAALAAYWRTPEADPYRLPALAHALALLPVAGSEVTAVAIHDAIERALERFNAVDGDEANSEAAPWTPKSWLVAPQDWARGGRFPVVVRWTTPEGAGDTVTGATIIEEGETQVLIHLDGTGDYVQLRWLENGVSWESVERGYPMDRAIPGWIDAARDWYELRTGPGAVRVAENEETYLDVRGLSWVFSVPVPGHAGEGYLVAGRVKMPVGQARFGWQVVDGEEHVIQNEALVDMETLSDWTWRVGYQADVGPDSVLRVVVDTVRTDSVAMLDDVMVLGLKPPVLP